VSELQRSVLLLVFPSHGVIMPPTALSCSRKVRLAISSLPLVLSTLVPVFVFYVRTRSSLYILPFDLDKPW
jgi:hypothetical protein